MKKILATIQDGQFSDSQIKTLQTMLRGHYQQHVDAGHVVVIWLVVPAGQAFTDYKPSQSSVVTMECDIGFAQEKRLALLQACQRDWCSITGQDVDHLMFSLSKPMSSSKCSTAAASA